MAVSRLLGGLDQGLAVAALVGGASSGVALTVWLVLTRALLQERALLDRNREMILILCKALNFSWDTTMALLFLGAKDHRITANDLRSLENDYDRLNIETTRSVLAFYQSRKNGTAPLDPSIAAALYA